MAKIKSEARLYLSKTGAVKPTPIAVTSITNTKPAVVTLAAAVPAGTANADVVILNDTGEPLLDKKAFRIAALDTTPPGAPTFELLDFDGTRLTGPVAAVGNASVYTKAALDAILLDVCLVNITVAGVAPDTINMDDMCDSTSVLGSPKPPTFTFSGFVNKESEGFKNLVQASLENPKVNRFALIDYTEGGGYIYGPVQIGEVTITAQTAQGLQFSGTGVFTEMPTYSWAL